MQVDYISDIHLDFHIKEKNPESNKLKKQITIFVEEVLRPKGAKVLILAGDQGHYFFQDTALLTELKNYYEHIIMVPGNHDLYLVSNNQVSKYLKESWNRVLEMKTFCSKNEGMHYFDGHNIVIDGYSFGGTGMSWDTSYAKYLDPNVTETEVDDMFKRVMNDANLIYSNGRDNYSANTVYGNSFKITSFDPFKYFKEQKQKLGRVEPCDVIITHYGPKVPDNLALHYQNSTTTFYYFDGEEDIKRLHPKFWVYGHTHTPYDKTLENGTTLICNPFGYPGENRDPQIQSFVI